MSEEIEALIGKLIIAALDDETRKVHAAIDEFRAAFAKLEKENAALKGATCEWKLDNGEWKSVWEGSCGVTWEFIDDGPEENECIFCPRCGKKIVILPQAPEPSK
jgi:predicted  nucleic acid-binding Zn-ribbon protein